MKGIETRTITEPSARVESSTSCSEPNIARSRSRVGRQADAHAWTAPGLGGDGILDFQNQPLRLAPRSHVDAHRIVFVRHAMSHRVLGKWL